MTLEEFRTHRQQTINFYGQISAADDHFVCLLPNGVCYAVGANGSRQCEVSKWKELKQIFAGTEVTVGLSGDKTLFSTDREIELKSAVLKGITMATCLTATAHDCAVVNDDGRITVLKLPDGESDPGQGYPMTSNIETVSRWDNVISIACGKGHIAALRTDGTVLAAGDGALGQTDVSGWKNVVQITASDNFTAGLTESGHVLVTGTGSPEWKSLSEKTAAWRDIIYIDASSTHLVALTQGGTVLDTSDFRYMSSWKSMVMVAAGKGYTLGLHTSGKTYYSGQLPGKVPIRYKKSYVNFEKIMN
ncbi:MAG: hypothetical protein IJ806_04400 [Ruminococcus sp.]|nr:hypothetical protein [Ruminococcus sp.]